MSLQAVCSDLLLAGSSWHDFSLWLTRRAAVWGGTNQPPHIPPTAPLSLKLSVLQGKEETMLQWKFPFLCFRRRNYLGQLNKVRDRLQQSRAIFVHNKEKNLDVSSWRTCNLPWWNVGRLTWGNRVSQKLPKQQWDKASCGSPSCPKCSKESSMTQREVMEAKPAGGIKDIVLNRLMTLNLSLF